MSIACFLCIFYKAVFKFHILVVWWKIICNKIINCGASNLSDEKQSKTFYKIHISATF